MGNVASKTAKVFDGIANTTPIDIQDWMTRLSMSLCA
jgi:hypothetical protein